MYITTKLIYTQKLISNIYRVTSHSCIPDSLWTPVSLHQCSMSQRPGANIHVSMPRVNTYLISSSGHQQMLNDHIACTCTNILT